MLAVCLAVEQRVSDAEPELLVWYSCFGGVDDKGHERRQGSNNGSGDPARACFENGYQSVAQALARVDVAEAVRVFDLSIPVSKRKHTYKFVLRRAPGREASQWSCSHYMTVARPPCSPTYAARP